MDRLVPVATDAFGSANVTVAGTVLTGDGSFVGFEATAAHVDGPAGVDEMAGPFFTLAVDKANTHFEGTFTMTAEQVGRFDDAGTPPVVVASSSASVSSSVRGCRSRRLCPGGFPYGSRRGYQDAPRPYAARGRGR